MPQIIYLKLKTIAHFFLLFAAVPTIESPSSDYLKSASIFSLFSFGALGFGPRLSSIILDFLFC